MAVLAQISDYCRTAIPFLGMFYAAMLIYFDSPKDRWVWLKQGVTFVFFAATAYFRFFGT
jgi:hypothetical protein